MVARTEHRELKPGSTGWTLRDLDAPDIARQWEERRVELVHGVIAEIPAAYFDHSRSVDKLFDVLKAYFWARGVQPEFGTDVDFALGDTVLYRADGLMLLGDDLAQQLAVQAEQGVPEELVWRIMIPPTLVVESVSLGHEGQDYVVKHDDYAKFGVPNYWVLNAYRKRLDCYKLSGSEYVRDASGESPSEVRPSAFQGLTIPLNKVFR